MEQVCCNGCRNTLDGYERLFQQGMTIYPHGTTYVMLTQKTIGNSDVETSFFDDTSAIGTRTFPANLLRVGSTIRMNLRCDLSSAGNPTNTIKIKVGGTTLITSAATLGAGHTDDYAELQVELLITDIGATGHLTGMGRTIISGTSDLSRPLIVASTVINTTTTNLIDVTYQWGTAHASNVLIVKQAVIQILN